MTTTMTIGLQAGKKDGLRSKLHGLLKRHIQAFCYVVSVILPVILKTGKRPVIFSRQTGMGDIICTIPVVRELIKRHPGTTFIYNCHRDFADVPRLAGVARQVTSLEPIGLIGHWYSFLLNGFYHFAHGDDISGRAPREPMVAEFLRQFQMPVTDVHPVLAAGPAAQEKVRLLLAQKNLDVDQLILIHPGPSWPIKEWPRECWTNLVKELRERGYKNIAQMGVGRYMNFGQVTVEPISGAVSLIDALSIEDCFAAIARAKLFIGIDSGLLHIAACTRTPAVALWGPTAPQFFYTEAVRQNFLVSGVECRGCYHRRPRLDWITGCPYDIKCMKTLSVESVLHACLVNLALATVG